MFSDEVMNIMLINLQGAGWSIDTAMKFVNDSLTRTKEETALTYWELMQMKAE